MVIWNQRFPKAIAFSDTVIKLSSSEARRHCSYLMKFMIVHRLGCCLYRGVAKRLNAFVNER